MAKHTNKKAKILEIAQDLANGCDRPFILGKYGKKWGASRTTLDRYIKDAQEDAKLILSRMNSEIERKATEEGVNAFKGQILSKLEKQDILRRIAIGELESEKLIIVKGEVKKVHAKPDQQDIMKAIDLDNKMSGDNSTTKLDMKLDGVIISAEERDRRIAELKLKMDK